MTKPGNDMKIKWKNLIALLLLVLFIGLLSFGLWLLKVWIVSLIING